jgi:urea transport system substrate-binding protein
VIKIHRTHIIIPLTAVSIIIAYYSIMMITQKTISVGILHSLTGPMAVYEKTAVDATLLAIEEVNKNGGILGKKLKPIIADGASDEKVFAREAERLITQEKVSVIFGCWRSTDRKAVKPIVEQHKNLLFYPVQHEGLEESPNIVYTSTIPNQQAIPAVTWCFKNLGKRFFIIGTDELFPRATNEIIKDTINALNGEVLAMMYLKPSSTDIMPIVDAIQQTQPDVIINTIFGSANFELFKEMRRRGITSEKIPTMSLSIDEPELQKYGADYMMGDYSCWSHFQSIQRSENKLFVEKIQNKYGKEYVISDAMEAAYYGIYLWKQAINKAQSYDAVKVIPALHNQAYDAPEGIISVDGKTLHTWSMSSVGKIRSDKQFTILWNSEKAIPPHAYPSFKTKEEWKQLLEKWYKEWGNTWSNKS